MDFKEFSDTAIFEPIVQFKQAGNEIQRCKTTYKNIDILWDTYFPWDIFKDPIDTFTVGLILPMDTVLINGVMNPNYYTEEGFGQPDFKELEDAFNFINTYKNG